MQPKNGHPFIVQLDVWLITQPPYSHNFQNTKMAINNRAQQIWDLFCTIVKIVSDLLYLKQLVISLLCPLALLNFIVVSFSLIPHHLSPLYYDRGKRGAIELAQIMKCASPSCDPIDYTGYGCFCGFMGEGVPVDGIDRWVKTCAYVHAYTLVGSKLEMWMFEDVWYSYTRLCRLGSSQGNPCISSVCLGDIHIWRPHWGGGGLVQKKI